MRVGTAKQINDMSNRDVEFARGEVGVDTRGE